MDYYWIYILVALLIAIGITFALIKTVGKKETFVNFDKNMVLKYRKKPKYKDGKYKITILYVNNSKNITKNSQKILNILKQNIKVDLIVFGLPLNEETAKGYTQVPDWLKLVGAIIPEVKSKSERWKDTGILTHVNLCKSGNNIGIVLNDKINYKENYIEQLLDFHESHQGYIINDGNKSILFKPEYYVESELLKNTPLAKYKVIKFSP